MINSVMHSIRGSAISIIDRWIAGELTDTQAITLFVELILSNR